MYVAAQRFRWENLRSIGFADISGTYSAVGAPFENPIRIIKFTNETDSNLIISTNGTDDKEIVTAGGFVLYDIATNKTDVGSGLFLDQGGTIYVKGSPSEGTFYVSAIYASSN